MLSTERLRDIVTQEVAGPPWDLHFDCENCVRARTQGWLYCASSFGDERDHVYFVQARLWRADTETGNEGWGEGSKIMLSHEMTEGEVIKKCFMAMRDYAEHEVREGFKWKGRRVLGPHISMKALYDVADTTETD